MSSLTITSTMPQYKGAQIICTNHLDIYSAYIYSCFPMICTNTCSLCTWIYIIQLDNMEPIVRREDVVAHDYVATAGNYFIGISTHASQLSHHSPPDSCTVLYSCTPVLTVLLTPASSQLTHHAHHTRGPITHQTSQQLHRLTSERRRPHQNNNQMDVGLSAPVNPLFDTNSNSLGAVVVDWRCGLIEMRRILGWRSFV